MHCPSCGSENPPTNATCSACHAPLVPPPPPPSAGRATAGSPVDDLLRDTEKAAKDLAAASARLSKRLAERASEAAKDPSTTAKKAVHKVAKELESVGQDIERLLKDL